MGSLRAFPFADGWNVGHRVRYWPSINLLSNVPAGSFFGA